MFLALATTVAVGVVLLAARRSLRWFGRRDDPAHLARRRRPPSADSGLLDLWTGGRRHAHACRAPASAWVATPAGRSTFPPGVAATPSTCRCPWCWRSGCVHLGAGSPVNQPVAEVCAPRAALKKMPHRVAFGSSDYACGQRRPLSRPTRRSSSATRWRRAAFSARSRASVAAVFWARSARQDATRQRGEQRRCGRRPIRGRRQTAQLSAAKDLLSRRGRRPSNTGEYGPRVLSLCSWVFHHFRHSPGTSGTRGRWSTNGRRSSTRSSAPSSARSGSTT